MAGPVAGRHSSSQLPTPYAGGHHQAGLPAPQARPDRTVFVLAIVSLGVGVPLTAIGSGTAGLPGLLVVWIGIVLVNLAYGWSRRKSD